MERTPNVRLQALVQAAGWSPTQLAHSLRAVAHEQGLSVIYGPQTVRRWLKGVRPRPPAPTLVLECLSRRLGMRLTGQEAGFGDLPATVVDPSWEADPLYKLHQLTRGELDPAHSIEFDARGFSLAALVLPDQFASASFGSLWPGSRVQAMLPGPVGAERIRDMTRLFHGAAEEYGGQHVRAALTIFLARRVMPQLSARMHESTRREILSATAQQTMLLATMCADSGQDRAAQHYHQVAAQLAAHADDSATLAIILRSMATHAYDLGHHSSTVLNLADQAAFYARHASTAVQVYTQCHVAVVQAHHDRHAALAALARAESLYSHADFASGPFTAYPPGALHYQRARTLATLGDHPGAVRALTTSLRMRTPAEYRAAVLTRAHLAEMLLRRGQLDEAIRHWHTFLTNYPALHSSRAARQLRTLREQLRPYQHHPPAAALLSQSRLLP